MRILGVGLVLLCGCGLLLDLDPPDMDAGPRADAGDVDAAVGDGGTPDSEEVDASIDVGSPDAGPMCLVESDCVVRDPLCTYECSDDNRCVETCDPPPVCIDGEIEYFGIDDSCATRALRMCVDETRVSHEFTEVESCDGLDNVCDGNIDVFDGFDDIECGIGECAGPRGCADECVGGVGDFDGCTAGSGPGLDDDCDGRVDEDCNAVDCIGVEASEIVSVTSGGTYCLDVGSCTTPVSFPVRGATLSDVRIYGDMRFDSDLGAYVPCPEPTPFAAPLAQVALQGTIQIDGPMQVSNVRIQPNATLSGTALIVGSGGSLRGDNVQIDGGGATALRVDAGGEAILSDVSVTSSSAAHTIDSAGRLVVESSCPNRTDPTRRCVGVSDNVLSGAISKTSPGNSVIHLSGPGASLRMTSVRVAGPSSRAIWAEGVGDIDISDSVLIARPASLPGDNEHVTVALESCAHANFRDTIIRNVGDSSSRFTHYGMRASDCRVRFSAPNLDAGPHIVGTTGASASAVGVSCGAGCSFEQVSIAGFGAAATFPDTSEALGVECGVGCTVVDSTVRANARPRLAGSATGLRIADGTVLRSRIGAGVASQATGIHATNPAGRARVHVQDSLVVGLVGTEGGGAIDVVEARGALVDATANFSALHSTIAARSMTRLAIAASCHAVEAIGGARVRLSSSVLWAPCVDGGYSYFGAEDGVVFMDHVGVDAEGYTFLDGSAVLNADTPFPYLLVPDPAFDDDYAGATLPIGAPEMTTERDVDAVPRGASSPIGAYAD